VPVKGEYLSGETLWDRFLALPTNIRLGWKGLKGANTLAYRNLFINYDEKTFITLASD
jgi:hypothetical protein